MAKIYTRAGDEGYTSLLGGARVRKDNLRVEVYGTLDEASSALGMAKSAAIVPILRELADCIQRDLFIICSELAAAYPKASNISLEEDRINWLEGSIDRLNEGRAPQKGFVMPGGTMAAGAFDLARTIIRRAERRCISLKEEEPVRPTILKYLNRLSDLLYAMARTDEHENLVKIITREVFRQMSKSEKTLPAKMLPLAKDLAEKAESHAHKIGAPMVIAVVDVGGNLVLCHRMDGALLVSIDIAVNKAYTAAGVKAPTHKLAELAQPGQPLYGIESTNNGKIVVFGGGYPLYDKGGDLIGGLGISGGSVEEDMQVAEAAISEVLDRV